MSVMIKCTLCSGGSRGGSQGTRPPLIFRPKWGSKGQNNFLGDYPHPPSKGLDDQASPLSQGLDPAVCILTWISIRLRLFVLSVLA